MATYLIIGNGVAGNAAAESIRRIDPQGDILLLAKEKYFFYYKPALPEYISGQKQVKDFTLHNESWYEKNRIDLHLETEVMEVDAGQKKVITQKGEKYQYDKLLLACGGNSFVPPFPGSQSPGVSTLRTIEDAEWIRQRAGVARKAVVIGGGLLGLEAGSGLRRLGLEVSVVEFFPRLLPRQTDITGSAILQRQMEEMGFRFYLGAKTQEIISAQEGLWVGLEGGKRLYAEMVLISAGVRPEVSLNKFLNLPVDKGVKVDDWMQTGLEGIYAAGDLVEHKGRYYGIWPAAMEQGRIAGANMAGQEVKYKGTVPSNTLKVAGIGLLAAGEIDPDEKKEAFVLKDEAKGTYRKIVFENDVIIGVILMGDLRGSDEIQKAIKNRKKITLSQKDLANPTFDFAHI